MSARAPTAVRAAAVLVLMKMSLAALGFHRTLRLVRALAERAAIREQSPRVLIDRTLRSVALAAVFYPGRAVCLEQSLVLYFLLRRRGIDAHFRVGVQPVPFSAHAWVEHEGVAIDESAERLAMFTPLPDV